MGSSFSSQSSNSTRASNPTEDKIAKEIREMKEREEELARRWQELQETKGDELTIEVHEEKEETVKEERKASSESKPSPVSPTIQIPSSKFNPSNYRPVIVPPRPRIMEDFLANKGKVTAFTPREETTVITLRRPQVHKSMPKVSPPVGTVRAPTGSVLDKIQAELAETKMREDELRRRRKDMSRSQPDLNKILEMEMKDAEEEVRQSHLKNNLKKRSSPPQF